MTTDAASPQRDVLAFLSAAQCPAFRDPTHPGADEAIDEPRARHVETHGAHVFIGATFVIKIKRAVGYSYLDMRALEARRQLCLREFELNHATLPDVYLGVFPITREPDGTFAMDGDGEPIEWALLMRRFEESDVLQNVAADGRLDAGVAQSLGESLATYHRDRPIVVDADADQRLREIVDELEHEFARLGRWLPPTEVQSLIADCRSAWEAARDTLRRRGRGGLVRRCHGDLHLRNIVYWRGRPVPFDALEFDERLATTDILYDLAFLLMDLAYVGLDAAANRVLTAWCSRMDVSADLDGLAALRLFLAIRAAIRAMTSAQTAEATGEQTADLATEETTARPAHDARAYLRLARSVIVPDAPRLVVLGGLSGSGKTSVARRLALRIARSPGALVLDSDAERKAAAGVAAGTSLPPERYTAAAAEANYRRLCAKADTALRAGWPVVLAATWLDAPARQRFMGKRRIEPIRLWLEAPIEVLRARLDARGAGDDVAEPSDAGIEVLERQLHRHAGPPDGWRVIRASDDLEAVVERCAVACEQHSATSVSV